MSIKKAEQQAQALLAKIITTTDLYTFEELIELYGKIVPPEAEFLFYLREKARFDTPSVKRGEYLYFQFLSFECSTNNFQRFSNKAALMRREQEMLAQGGHTFSGPLTNVVCLTNHPKRWETFFSITQNIFVAFYRNCGSYEHFRDSIGYRFSREFSKEFDYSDIDKALDHIQESFEIDVALCAQRDPMFVDDDNANVDDLVQVLKCTSFDFEQLFKSPNVARDIHRSVSYRNQTFGYDRLTSTQYVVRTFSDDYLDNNKSPEKSSFRSYTTGVAVYAKKDDRLSLDSIHSANRLLQNVLSQTQEREEEQLLWDASEACLTLEEELSYDPQGTWDDLNKEFRSGILTPLIDGLLGQTEVNNVSIYRYQPFGRTLSLIGEYSNADAAFRPKRSIPLSQSKYVAAQAFITNAQIRQRHHLSVEKERRRRERFASLGDQKAKEALENEKPRLLSADGNTDLALLAVPIRLGSVVTGVVEFASDTVGSLALDAHFLLRVASEIGEALRRVELANDRAWLSQMSYVHASRHSIEGALRDIGDANEGLANELRRLIGAHRKQIETKAQTDEVLTGAELRSIIVETAGRHSKVSNAEPFADRVVEALAGATYPPTTLNAFVDIVETLCANSATSPLDLEDVQLAEVHSVDTDTSSFEILFDPSREESQIKIDRLQQVGVAPIRDDLSPTYHYGLFLQAAQVRMIGGSVATKPINDDGLGFTKFGVAFHLPGGA